MMYSDLFSSMDGARTSTLWLLPLLALFPILLSQLWVSGAMSSINLKISSVWVNENTKRYHMLPTMAMSVFLLLVINNVLGLTPFTYTLSSDLFVVSSLSVVFWMLLLASGYVYSPMASLAHLAPSGAPLALLPFLVLVESISILIRPLTLTVRLVANISAGHIVLGLLANVNSSLIHSAILPLCMGLTVAYTLFEFFVSAIQAYIFTLLITLYSAEHP